MESRCEDQGLDPNAGFIERMVRKAGVENQHRGKSKNNLSNRQKVQDRRQ